MSSGGGVSGSKTDTQGGISPEQMALTQYTYGEGILNNAAKFGSSGTGLSTMNTMADAGTGMQQALTAQQLSQSDAAAVNAFNQQSKNQTASGIGSLGNLAGSLGPVAAA